MSAIDTIAVVGGGIFGVSIAVRLGNAGYRVYLYEKNRDLLTEASGTNQRRLHKGYHYPRCDATATSVNQAGELFNAEYHDAITRNAPQYFCIAREGSHTHATEYEDFCHQNRLPFRPVHPNQFKKDGIELCVETPESLLDLDMLRKLSWEKLSAADVSVHTDTRASHDVFNDHDSTVVATYSAYNDLLASVRSEPMVLEFRVCEMALVRPPRELPEIGFVVMDGPFINVSPIGVSRLMIISGTPGVHASNVGHTPVIPPYLRQHVFQGIIPKRYAPRSRFAQLVDCGSRFVHGFESVEHVGSCFAVKALLPHLHKTDSRPTVVERIGDNSFGVFGGKIIHSVSAAEQVLAGINSR